MTKQKSIPPYYCINWDVNHDKLEFYNIMPYFVSCWNEEKKHKHKHWNLDFDHTDKNIDNEHMPETFDEFKKFIEGNAFYQFWSRCQYEVIVTGWPIQKKEHKLDIYEQIKANIDVITKHFMDYILQTTTSKYKYIVKAYAAEEVSPRNCWIYGIKVGDELPLEYADKNSRNFYKTVMKRGTYIGEVTGDIDFEIPVKIIKRRIVYKNVTI